MNSREDIVRVVYETVATTFDYPIEQLNGAATASDIEGWDSVTTSMLFLNIEERVGVELDIDKLLKAENLEELATLVFEGVARKSGSPES
jgi:acyl carrier protein